MLKSQSKSRLVGANSPGMIGVHGKCRLGFHPLPFFTPGSIGIMAKSGTLSYETVAATTRAGLGQSLVIGMGGDPLPGTDFVDALQVFEEDEETKGIILVGEIGGRAEDLAAQWIQDYHLRVRNPKYEFPFPLLVERLTLVGRSWHLLPVYELLQIGPWDTPELVSALAKAMRRPRFGSLRTQELQLSITLPNSEKE